MLALTASGKVVSAAARDAGAIGDAEDRGAVRVCTFDATLFAEGFPSPDSPAAPPGAALHWSEHLHAVVVAWDGMVPLLCVAAPDLRTLVGRPVMFPAACARLALPLAAARGRPGAFIGTVRHRWARRDGRTVDARDCRRGYSKAPLRCC